MNKKKLAGYIDHTLLKPEATQKQIEKICDEAMDYGFASVCVNTCWIKFVADKLKESDVRACCVVGFPLGAAMTEAKVEEAKLAVAAGAEELDMVISIGAAKSGDWEYIEKEIADIVKVKKGAKLKVIIEACLLTDDEKVLACLAAKAAGADFVKTSTGFSTGGATVEDIILMRKIVGDDMGVKASGGIKSYKDAISLIDAGASRVGTSASIAIVS